MDYRGEKIRLSKKYVDYDDYKNDPANLAASEIRRVEKLMTDAKVGPDFADWHDVARQPSNIKFPGYGMGSNDDVVAAGRELSSAPWKSRKSPRNAISFWKSWQGGVSSG